MDAHAHTTPMRVIGGRYRLVEFLAAGGMGRVWKAHDQNLGVDVAVKEVLRRPGLSDEYWSELLIRARREARHGAKLRNHPNIVAVFDVVVEDSLPWTVMRLVKGRSLETRLKTGPLSLTETQKVAEAIINALGAAHDAGIIHRDVKPANIMLADDGNILLTDFGIAVNDADTKLTQDGGIIGSMAYIAPERADGHQGNEASDLFSLGATLYETAEGTSPFQRDTVTGTLRAVAFHEPPAPARAGHLAPLITALLNKEPGNRPSVTEALVMAKTHTATATTTEGQPSYDVLLQDVGERRYEVVQAIRQVTGGNAMEAADLVDAVPRAVLSKVNFLTANTTRRALLKVGATAILEEHDPQATPEERERGRKRARAKIERAESSSIGTGWFWTLAVLAVVIWHGSTHQWLPNLWRSAIHAASSSAPAVHFVNSGSRLTGTCKTDTGCPVTGWFTNTGRQTGAAGVTFSLTNDKGLIDGLCTAPIPVAAPHEIGFGLDERGQDLALVDLRAGQGPGDGQPGRRADQVQFQAPEPARVRAAVTVAGPAGQRRAARGVTRTPAFHGRGVSDPDRVGPQVGRAGQVSDGLLEQRPGGAQALVVAGPVGQPRSHAAQVGAGKTDPAGLGVEAEQGLGHGQTDQLGVRQSRRAAQPPRSGQMVIDLHVECGQEGVQLFGRHNPNAGRPPCMSGAKQASPAD
ncbi:ribosomal protein L7/L12 [Kitasatospora sp. NPDC051170]|uniref:ribosomal protein L7/L12 n=1 Tax=Kitasatospora sp. NPDC051170 TaxID=3364056 RepID=UPI003787473C